MAPAADREREREPARFLPEGARGHASRSRYRVARVDRAHPCVARISVSGRNRWLEPASQRTCPERALERAGRTRWRRASTQRLGARLPSELLPVVVNTG